MEIFGHLPNGEPVNRVEICNKYLRAKILSWGSVLQDLRYHSSETSLVLGLETLEDYLNHSRFSSLV